jgi:Holliday junction DNA helicase RuvA
LIGFTSDAERDFFELVCSVDGVGVKKTLKAMVRPVREVAEAIVERDAERLTLLPGVGPAVADRIIAKLHRKMTPFALMVDAESSAGASDAAGDLVSESLDVLVGLGHSASEARLRLDAVLATGVSLKTVEDVLREVYRQQRGAS